MIVKATQPVQGVFWECLLVGVRNVIFSVLADVGYTPQERPE
jgi:hypothetical protein